MGPNTPGHGATEILDENLSYVEGEEPLKKAELIPLNEVDNRYVEEGVVVLSRPDADNTPAKYEQDMKTKEKSKDTDRGKGQEKNDVYRKGVNFDAISSKDTGNQSGVANSHLGKQGLGNIRVLSTANVDMTGSHQVSSSKYTDKDVAPSPGDRLPPPGPSVGHGLSMSANHGGTSQGGRGRLVRLHERFDNVDYAGSEKTGNTGNMNQGFAGTLDAGEPSNENENMRLESQPDLASRAAITFALMQTDDKTHTQCDEAAEDNATRAAPFTMASQWGPCGSSDEGSNNEDSEDDGGGDKGKKSSRMKRCAVLNTLADEDDHQLDSMTRNSLVLVDEKDGVETMRTSLVFEDDSTDVIKLMQSSSSRAEEGSEGVVENLSRNTEPAHQSHHQHHSQPQEKSFSSSPRKMPEKLAKDIDNRIGSPMRHSSTGSPSKFVFKNRDQGDEKKFRKPMALGKPPIHTSSKREKSDVTSSGLNEGGRPLGSMHASTRNATQLLSKPKSILRDKNTLAGERNLNVDNRFSTDVSLIPAESSSDGRVVLRDEPNMSMSRDQSPRRPPTLRHSSSKSKEPEQAGSQHVRRISRPGSSMSPRGYADSRPVVLPDSDEGPVPKPPPGHAPKSAVVTAR